MGSKYIYLSLSLYRTLGCFSETVNRYRSLAKHIFNNPLSLSLFNALINVYSAKLIALWQGEL